MDLLGVDPFDGTLSSRRPALVRAKEKPTSSMVKTQKSRHEKTP
jgi:hypothetical protein